MTPDSEIWSMADACEHLKCSRPHVVKLATEEGLPHFRLGKLWRFRKADVLHWEEEQIKKGAA